MADNTTTQTNIQGFASQIAPYAESTLGAAAKAVEAPYQSYADWARKRGLSGDQVQAFTDLQRKAFTGAEGLAQDPYSQAAAQGIQGLADRAGNLNYAGTQFGNQFQAPSAYQASQVGNQFQAPQNLGYTAQDARNTQLGAAPTVERQPTYDAPGMEAAQTGYDPRLQNYQMGPARDVTASSYMTPEMRAAQTGYNPQLQTFQMGPAERVNAQGVSAGDINAAQMGPAERVNTQSFAQPGSADAYMSPYMQNVVDIQKREAARQSGIQGLQQQAQAVSAGAFGGSRDAIMRAERERNLAQQTGDIQAQGSQAAYQQAQQQFNAEQQARLQAQQANQQAGINVGGQNLNAQQQANVQNAANALQAKGMSADAAMKAALANQQSELTVGQQNLTAQQQAEVQNAANKLQASGMTATQAMQAALANQQAGLTVGQQNLAAKQGTQQLQANADVQVQLANLNAAQQANVQNAAQQFQASGMNADQAMKAALANQSTSLTTGTQNAALEQQANLANANAANTAAQFGAAGTNAANLSNTAATNTAAQFGAGQGLTAAQTAAQYGQAAAQLGEQSKQFGAGQGLAALQAAGQTEAALGAQGQNIYNQGVNNLGIQNTMGTQQQQNVQNMLTQNYTDYQNEVNLPFKQLGFMSDIVRGAPTSVQGTTITTPAPSVLNQVAGAATALTGFGLPVPKARGGAIKQKKIAGLPAILINSMARG
jgi:hypothetical protein